MNDTLGPQSQRVYRALHERILNGQLVAGEQLPTQTKLAADFGVALMTVRQALNHLQARGMVYTRQGLGTFVREQVAPAVLIVEDDLQMHKLLSGHASDAGYRVLTASHGDQGLAILENDPHIALIFSDVRMPTKDQGINFIRAVRHRWPNIPLVAITGYAEDLVELHGTPEFPLLVLPKPAWSHQIELAFSLAARLGFHRDLSRNNTP